MIKYFGRQVLAGLLPVLVGVACMDAGAREPTEFEQYMLELINRARIDPEAEVVRLGTGSLNEGPPTLGGESWTIVPGARQPMAFNSQLVDAASDYAQLLNLHDAFTHTYNGTSPDSRMIAAGYIPAAYDSATWGSTADYGGTGFLPGRENLARGQKWPVSGWTVGEETTRVSGAHEGLFNDSTVPSRGHRSTMMYGQWQEAGVGISKGTDVVSSNLWDSHYIAHSFANQAGNPFLTGVAYNDVVDDDFYTPESSEALGGLTVTAYNAGTTVIVASTTTFASGGYSLQLPTGTYDVRFTGGNIDSTVENVGFTSGLNKKLDLIDPPAAAADADNDGVPDDQDNCLNVPNPDQRNEPNDDIYGNVCDPDFDNSGTVNFSDLGYMKSVFFSSDAEADLNGDGSVNFTDLGIMKSMFFGPPGPSGL